MKIAGQYTLSPIFLLALLWPAGRAAEIARWTPERSSGISVARIIERDYFRRSAFVAKVEKPVTGPVWLVLEYPDKGYAEISVSPGVAHSDQWGVARLNTGKMRRAVFHYRKPDFSRPIRIYGLEQVNSVTLVDSAPPAEAAPLVEPAVKLQRPMQLVTTAGADAQSPEQLPEALAMMRNLLPLARALGFNGIESYVKWNFVERKPGVFDWGFYDAVVAEIEKHGLKWFPLLIVGSAYALPEWFFDSPDFAGYECLEHGLRSDIPTIFSGTQDKYVRRFLAEFGKHYAGRGALLGIRLGPSGNYGEAQYPARGDWRYKGRVLHTHIGYWAADRYAVASFRDWLRPKYPTVADLNTRWGSAYRSLEEVTTFLPVTAHAPRKRIDFADWYMDSMSEWCEKWARWAREAMPKTIIHQSSGGWGPIEIGTDYTYQARSMARLGGGIRLTNESDNFPQNFAITRMASSAARFYGAQLGYEPGGFGSARGVMARLYNCATNGGEHLFYYHSNLYANDQAIGAWLAHAGLMDRRAKPMTDVAAFYPDTAIKLDDEVLRHLWASAFLTRAEAMRSTLDYDYMSEPMVKEGALDRYQALIFLWGHVTEKPVLDRLARWVESGGTLIYPERPRGPLQTVEGDLSAWRRWQAGETGKGRVIFFSGDPEPGEPYARFVLDELRKLAHLRPAVRDALRMDKPAGVYWSVLETGDMMLLNFSDDDARVTLTGGRSFTMRPYTIRLER